MDKAERRVSIIEAHLTAISRGAKPSFDQIAVWVRELDHVPIDDIDSRIRQARDEHADKVEQGKEGREVSRGRGPRESGVQAPLRKGSSLGYLPRGLRVHLSVLMLRRRVVVEDEEVRGEP